MKHRTIELSTSMPEAEAFADYLRSKGHEVSIGKVVWETVDGRSTKHDEKLFNWLDRQFERFQVSLAMR